METLVIKWNIGRVPVQTAPQHFRQPVQPKEEKPVFTSDEMKDELAKAREKLVRFATDFHLVRGER